MHNYYKEENSLSPFIKNTIFCTLLALCSFPLHSVAQITSAKLIPKKGLFISTQNLTWCMGSEVNFFTPNKRAHHYFFTWWDQDIDSTNKQKDILFLGSSNTAVDGNYTLTRTANKFTSTFNCRYNLKVSSLADIVFAKLWMPFLKEAIFKNNKQEIVENLSDFEDSVLQVFTPFGNFRFIGSHAFRIKINATPVIEKNAFETRNQFLELFEQNILVDKLNPLTRSFAIEEVNATATLAPKTTATKMVLMPIQKVWQPTNTSQHLLPKPKIMELEKAFYYFPFKADKVIKPIVEKFRDLLKLDWQIKDKYYPLINTQISNLLQVEEYEITVTSTQINICHKTNAGLNYALQTLAQLVENKDNHLAIPLCKISDQPSINWRGIHMFTGPTSLALHTKMYEHILFPLKMNKTVLQCEQALWNSRPEVHNPISISTTDLIKEFIFLRKNFVEPIPLIQSLGHMEWFFKPKQNRFMAINPQYPYTLNPNLKESKRAITQIWDETFKLLKPKTIHIGFDEIGMIGFNQPREREIEYFKTQISFLNKYARAKKAKLMLWGDMGLANGEGPDALNGLTKQRAATIRRYIPKGSIVADWHYISNANAEIYKPNLKIWKQNGNFPVASPWLHPNNIKGFVQAAIDEKAGILQTTWADFESSEINMLQYIEQFGAYILALDYAWSGRSELPKDLPYNATEQWVKRFYKQSKPIQNKDGLKVLDRIKLIDITSNQDFQNPASVKLKFNQSSIEGFGIKATTNNILPEGTLIAEITLMNEDKCIYVKKIRYGVDVRAKTDNRILYASSPWEDARTVFHFYEKQIAVNAIRIRTLHLGAGLSIDELVFIK